MKNRTKLECLEHRQILREGRLERLQKLYEVNKSKETANLILKAEKQLIQGLKEINQHKHGIIKK